MTSSSNRILYVVSLNHATNDGSVYILSSLFPIVLALFNLSVFQVGIIVALGYLVNILFQPVVGHYSERRDPAKLLAMGVSIITFSIISFVFATGFLSLLASVILLRLGSSFFHPVGISTISKSYSGPSLQKSMGFQSAFGNLGVLLVFLISAPLYLVVGWRSTFIVFAIWTLADVVLTLTVLRGRHSATANGLQTRSKPHSQTKRTIPVFFIVAAFISGGTYAVILNFANIFLGTRAHLDVSQANLVVSAFIAFASLGACNWRLDTLRPNQCSLGDLLSHRVMLCCRIYAVFRRRDPCDDHSACYWVCNFRHLSFDLHGVVPLLGLGRSASWRVLRGTLVWPDNRRIDLGIG